VRECLPPFGLEYLSTSTLTKNIEIKTPKYTSLLVILYACKTWSLMLRKDRLKVILYCDQQMINCLRNYHTPTRFDTIVLSSGSLQSVPCQVTQVFQMQLLVIEFIIM